MCFENILSELIPGPKSNPVSWSSQHQFDYIHPNVGTQWFNFIIKIQSPGACGPDLASWPNRSVFDNSIDISDSITIIMHHHSGILTPSVNRIYLGYLSPSVRFNSISAAHLKYSQIWRAQFRTWEAWKSLQFSQFHHLYTSINSSY